MYTSCHLCSSGKALLVKNAVRYWWHQRIRQTSGMISLFSSHVDTPLTPTNTGHSSGQLSMPVVLWYLPLSSLVTTRIFSSTRKSRTCCAVVRMHCALCWHTHSQTFTWTRFVRGTLVIFSLLFPTLPFLFLPVAYIVLCLSICSQYEHKCLGSQTDGWYSIELLEASHFCLLSSFLSWDSPSAFEIPPSILVGTLCDPCHCLSGEC